MVTDPPAARSITRVADVMVRDFDDTLLLSVAEMLVPRAPCPVSRSRSSEFLQLAMRAVCTATRIFQKDLATEWGRWTTFR